MKKSLLFLVACCMLSCAGFAQGKRADSLLKELATAKNDITRADLLNESAEALAGSDPQAAFRRAQEAQSLAQKIGYRLAEGTAFQNLGNASIMLGNYAKALENFESAKAVFERELQSAGKPAAKNGLARALGSIGIVFSEQSNYARALEYHLKAVRIYEETGNKEKASRVYNNIGIVYKAQGEPFKALQHFIKCFDVQQHYNDYSSGITATNIGNCYLALKDYPKAFQYYSQARGIFEKYPDFRGLGELHNNLGIYYHETGNYEKALVEYDKAVKKFSAIDAKFGLSDTYALIGAIYFAQKDYAQAKVNVEKSLELGKMLGILERIRDSEKMLSDIYAKLDRPDLALVHFRLFHTAHDSILSHENIRSSVRAEMNYDFEKREALRKKDQEKRDLLAREQHKQHLQQLFFLALFVLLALGIVFLIYNRRQLKTQLTLQKEVAEYEQKALHLQMNPHFVFNCLGSISSYIVQNGTDTAVKYLSKFSKLMRLTLEYSKEPLIPIDKEIESLENYLELEQLRFNNVFSFTIDKGRDIEDDMALPPLLLQPFVENAIIHGLMPKKESGHISISFEIEGETLVCTILDNGVGFDKSQQLKENLVNVHKSMALDITKKRLQMMESATSKPAQVDIKELKNEAGETTGTKVVLRLPLQYLKI